MGGNSSRQPMGSIQGSAPMPSRNDTDRQMFENSFGGNFIPIAALNVNSHSWKIKAKIETKSNVKSWTKGDKPMSKFSVILVDNKGGKIEGVFWQEAVPRFFESLNEGQVYEVSNGQLRIQQRQWATTDHSCSIHFGLDAQFVPCEGVIENVLNLKKIDELNEQFGTADLLVKVISHTDLEERNTRNGPTVMKRITVCDLSLKKVELTVWGDTARKFEEVKDQLDQKCILAMQNCSYKNNEQYGRQLSYTDNSKFFVNPIDIKSIREKYVSLKKYFEQHDDQELENMTNARVMGSLPLRTPAYLQALNTDQLTDRKAQDAFKSLTVGICSFQKKPDS